MNLKINHITVNNYGKIFERDFQLENKYIESDFELIKTDIAFSSEFLNYNLITEIKFEIFNDTIKYSGIQKKDHLNKVYNITIEGKTYNRLEDFLNEINVKNHIPVLITKIEEESLIEAIILELAYTSKKSLDKVNSNIKDVEAKIEEFRKSRVQINEVKKEYNKYVTQENDSYTRLKSVSGLTSKLEELDEKIKSYNNLDLNQANIIKQNRLQDLINRLTSTRVQTSNPLHIVSEKIRSSSPIEIRSVEFSILSILQMIFAIYLYLNTFRPEIIILSLFAIIINALLYISYSKFDYKEIHLAPKASENKNNNYKDVYNKENELLINSAWLKALIKERDSLDLSIKNLLGGTPLEELNKTMDKLNEIISGLESRINEMQKNTLSKDDYNDSRRKLDILKVTHNQSKREVPFVLLNIVISNFKIDINYYKQEYNLDNIAIFYNE